MKNLMQYAYSPILRSSASVQSNQAGLGWAERPVELGLRQFRPKSCPLLAPSVDKAIHLILKKKRHPFQLHV
jgi:hypothetical protein